MLTVKADPDLGVVVFVGNLPDIKRLRGRIRQQAEEEDDCVGWGQTFRMDLPGNVKNIHLQRPDRITPRLSPANPATTEKPPLRCARCRTANARLFRRGLAGKTCMLKSFPESFHLCELRQSLDPPPNPLGHKHI